MPAERCPHCAEACPFANVWAASRVEDVAALELRYQAALDDAKARGCDAVAQDFATALDGLKAVIARHIHDVERLGFSDSECYTTFHQALDGGCASLTATSGTRFAMRPMKRCSRVTRKRSARPR